MKTVDQIKEIIEEEKRQYLVYTLENVIKETLRKKQELCELNFSSISECSEFSVLDIKEIVDRMNCSLIKAKGKEYIYIFKVPKEEILKKLFIDQYMKDVKMFASFVIWSILAMPLINVMCSSMEGYTKKAFIIAAIIAILILSSPLIATIVIMKKFKNKNLICEDGIYFFKKHKKDI